MRLLLDTDVLIDLVLEREPFVEPVSALFDILESRPSLGWIAWHSASNLHYLAAPVRGDLGVRNFLDDLLGFVEVAPIASESLRFSLRLEMRDFEDAMQVGSAVACGASHIVTRNLKDYRKSPIPALSPAQVLERC